MRLLFGKSLALVLVTGLQVVLFLWLFKVSFNGWAEHPWLIWGLPFAGLLTVAAQKPLRTGLRSTAGILQNLAHPEGQVRWYASPFALIMTCISQIFGASTGREGTAIHIGAGTADGLERMFPSKEIWHREFLVRGAIAAGFGGVFGTPLAAAMFAFENDGAWKRWKWTPWFLFASYGAKFMRDALIHQPHLFPEIVVFPESSLQTLLAAVTLIIVTGVFARLFMRSFTGLEYFFAKRNPFLVVFLTTSLIVALTLAAGTLMYNDLGVTLIKASFGGQTIIDWRDAAMKSVFTLLSATGGLKGGEVTPILAIGCALGSTVAIWTGALALPLIAIGCASFFGAVTASPLTAAFLSAEYFGWWSFPATLLVTYLACLIAQRKSIYRIPH